MVSQLKSETARANGAKSRGPTSAEGKEKSSRNSLKHGLTAGSGNILLDCEDPTQFDETFSKLFGIHEPATPAETDLVEEMVAARWRIRRMWTIETNLLNVEILTQQSKTGSPEPGIHLAMAFRSLADDSRSLALASRYEARLQRLYDRAYKTLRELQQARKSEPPEQPRNIEIKWVESQEGRDMRAAASQTAQEADLRNEPTAAANKEDSVPQASVPVSRNAEPPVEAEPPTLQSEPTHPKSEIRDSTSVPYNGHNDPIR